MKIPKVYIILLNWNGFLDTIECVETLNHVKYKNFDVIIVDNGSTDNSVAEIKKKYPQIKLIINKNNLGFAGGCNTGVRYSLKNNADYILLLNNDTIVTNDFLSELVKCAESDRKIGIVSPIIFYSNQKNKIWSTGAVKNKKSNYGYIDKSFQMENTGQFNKSVEVDCVWGCSMLINKSVFDKVGFLNDDYFLYVEDVDFCYRVKDAGFKILYTPKSVIYHKVSGSTGGEGNPIKDYYNSRNLVLFANKNLKGMYKYKYLIFLIIDHIKILGILLMTFKFLKFKSTMLGLFHGFILKQGFHKFA